MSAAPRLSRASVFVVQQRLSERDRQVLDYVGRLRLLGARQIQTLVFPDAAHATPVTAARSCRRVLERLTEDGLLTRLQRRIGGIRAGSASYVYALTSLGQRVLDFDGARRRLSEPSAFFVDHTLAIADFLVRLVVAARAGEFVLNEWQAEPACWRDVSTLGGRIVLRPDLFVVLLVGGYELRWFVEIDRSTEHLPTLLRKCRLYHTYYYNGAEQREHEVFPRVLWVALDQGRSDRLRDAIANDRRLSADIFRFTSESKAILAVEDRS